MSGTQFVQKLIAIILDPKFTETVLNVKLIEIEFWLQKKNKWNYVLSTNILHWLWPKIDRNWIFIKKSDKIMFYEIEYNQKLIEIEFDHKFIEI